MRAAPAQRRADRRVVGHQLALAAVAGEADDDDAARLAADHHAVAERGVDDVVAHAEDLAGRVAAWRRRPRRRPPPRPPRRRRGRSGSRRARARRWSVSSFGISSMNRERTPKRVGAERVAAARGGEREVAHRAGDADVREPPLLLHAALVDRARVREHAVLHPDDEDDRELEALGVVERHQRHEALVVADAVGVGEQRDLLQELLDRAVLGGRVVLARRPARAPRGSRSGPAPRSSARPRAPRR